MHAILRYRGNRPTHTHTHRQDRLQYTVAQLASVQCNDCVRLINVCIIVITITYLLNYLLTYLPTYLLVIKIFNKHFPFVTSPSSSSLTTMQNLVVVSHTLGAHVEGPKTFVDAGASPLWDGAMVLDEIPTLLCQISSVSVNHLGAGRGSQKWGMLRPRPLGIGSVADPLDTRFSATCVTMPSLVILGQTIGA